MNRTKIEWAKNPDGTQGYTWNPITGCLNGCEYCYARKLANGRLKPLYLANQNVAPAIDTKSYDPFYPRFWEDRLPEPNPHKMLWKGVPMGIFVCDMSDLFGLGIPKAWTERVLEVIKSQPWHRFYLLTKQPQNLAQFSPFPDNCWVGVTATNAKMAFGAEDYLAHIEAKVKYISFEPLLSRVENPDGVLACLTRHIDWVIIGAQTKPYKPPKIEWVEEITKACDQAGIPVFHKDNLKPIFPVPTNTLRQEMPEGR